MTNTQTTTKTIHFFRTLAVLVAMLAAMLVASGVALAATSTSFGSSFQIRDNNTASAYPSAVSFNSLSGTVTDVNLTLDGYRHSFPDDVDVLLAHAGKNRTVMSDRGNGLPGVSNITITLDDEAALAVPDETNPTGGRFRPANSERNDGFPSPAPTQNNRSALSAFDTLNPNGTWRLFVQDDSGQDCGKFGGGWSITIKAAVPQ
jgi:hypothetical protein